MEVAKDLLPVSAILIVILSMSAVDVFIIGEPVRIISAVPIVLVLIIWMIATIKVRGNENAR